MKLNNIINPRSIPGTGFLSVLVTILIIAPTIGTIWTLSEYRQKQRDIETIRNRYIDAQKINLKNDIKNVLNFIDYKKNSTMNRIKDLQTQRVHNAYSMASHIYSMDRMQQTPDRIKSRIVETLRPLRWDNGTGYFFIIDTGGVTWLNADRPELEGQCILSYKDVDGRYIIQDMIDLARNNESGFYRYAWTKPGTEGDGHMKMAFIKRFEPFDWIICTGAYIDDMVSSIQTEVLIRIRQITDYRNKYIFVIQDNGFCLSDPIEKYNRKNIIDHTAPDGRKVIQELLAVSGNPLGGFLEYPWEKPEDGKIAGKLAYAMTVADWNWTIGTGVYLDDIQQTLSREKARFRKELRNNLLIIFYVSLVAVLLALVAGFVITQRLYRGIMAFTDFFQKAAKEEFKINRELLIFREFQILGDLANQMVEDRSRKENALTSSIQQTRALQNLLKNIMDSMPSVLIAVDRDLQVIQWNKQARIRTGKRYGQVAMHPVDEVFPLTPDETRLIRQAVESGSLQMARRVEKKTPEGTAYENITVYPLTSADITGAVIRIDDVTENVKMEEMMIQSEKMMSVGGLAAGMAHEINNPLSGIIGNTDVLKNRLLVDLPVNQEAARQIGTDFQTIQSYAEKRELHMVMENIRQAGTRAATIVSDMLSFSRKSSSRFSMTDLAELLDKTVELASTNYDLKTRFDFKKIRISRRYQPVPEILCESGKIQQVFLNILTNGAQAMAEKPDNRFPEFTLTIRKDHDHVAIDIRDNGPGMEKEVAKRIFEPFFTTKAVGVGTGLGLSVSYFIITDHHNGSIDVESRPGEGTTFTIRLPVRPD